MIYFRFLPSSSLFDKKPKRPIRAKEINGCNCQIQQTNSTLFLTEEDQRCYKGAERKGKLLHTIDITKKVLEMKKNEYR